MCKMKKGVSLITVLMFMLVATIAATATFKWLSSQNASSGSRLYLNEARQAAIAGIESSRSWMINHGNETGAALKQFLSSENLDNNGKRKPVMLDQVLSDLNGENQSYSVAIVNADVTEIPYKVKVVSIGKSRNGLSKHAESAIFKVNGLYRVNLPKEREPVEPLDFRSSYHGGTTGSTEGVTLTSMTVNGDWSGNPPKIIENFVVTGKVTLSGNKVNGGENNCFGAAEINNGGIEGGNLYVEEDATTIVADIKKNAYFNGNVKVMDNTGIEGAATYALRVVGNMTVNKTITTSSNKKTTVYGNFCMCADDGCTSGVENAKINALNATKPDAKMGVQGNVWIPNGNAIITNRNKDGGQHLVLGDIATGASVYIQNAVTCATAKKADGTKGNFTGFNIKTAWGDAGNLDLGTKSKCSGNWVMEPRGWVWKDVCDYPNSMTNCLPGFKYFQQQSNAQLYGTVSSGDYWYHVDNYGLFKTNDHSTVVGDAPASRNFECAESAKTVCDRLWSDNTSECPGTSGNKHMVQNPLQLASEESLNAKANKASCVLDILNLTETNDKKQAVQKFSDCYRDVANKSNRSDLFYSDSFLVVKADANTLNQFFVNDYATKDVSFDGKFLFIVSSGKFSGYMPTTKENAFVMFYLKEGGGEINTNGGEGKRNYFFYSLAQIDAVLNQSPSKTWNGSFYFPVESCSGVTSLTMAEMKLLFNEDLLKSLGNNGILCSSTSPSCGEVGGESTSESGGGSGSSDAETTSGFDSDFIAVGSQLNIELESEYKGTEEFECASNDCGLKQSIMVLPRIIYMTKNPKGKLSDYYSVVRLNTNGAELQGNGTVTCTIKGTNFPTCVGSPSTSGLIYTGTDLGERFYRYTYSEQINGLTETSVFYVKVNGQTGETPAISFGNVPGESSGLVELNSTTANDVELTLVADDASLSYSGNFSVDIKMTTPPSDKWVVTLPDGSPVNWTSGNIYTYSGPISTTPVPVLKIHTEVGARSGSLMFNLRSAPLVNCNLGSHTSKVINISGKTTVHRASIEQYCIDYPSNCEGESNEFKNAAFMTDYVGSNEWIHAYGESCNKNTLNEEWECESGGSIYLSSGTYDSKYYTLFLPEANNSIDGALADGTEGVPDGGYKLYASLKKKTFGVNVGLLGASSGRVKIFSKNNLDDPWPSNPDKTCSDNECVSSYNADTHIKLVAVDGSGDVFNYWTCSEGGASCNTSDHENATSIEFTLDDNYSYVAHYNEKDPYCFYSDFSNTSIWCSDDMMVDCIDYCASGTSCSVKETHYAKSGWMLVKSNSGTNFVKPSVTGGYLHKGNERGSSLILSTSDGSSSEGGANGVYTTRIKAGNVAAISRNDYMKNSGYVVRSNATGTEYILISVYTVYGLSANGTFSRVCYINTASSTRTCKEYEIHTKNAGLDFYALNLPLNLSITLKGHEMDIDASYSGTKGLIEGKSQTINLKEVVNQGEYVLEDGDHPYLGVSLDNDDFRVGDLSWHISGEKGSKCFADPSASCSFAANYLGGLVPGGEGTNEEVYPWVGFSSWFTTSGQDCVTKYYYNGCDMSSSYFKKGLSASIFNGVACGGDPAADGYYQNYLGDDGLQVNDDGKFKFGYEGLHGFAKENGFVRNASIVVDCREVNGHKYEANCGEFFVGKQTSCSKNEPSIFSGADYLSMETKEYPLPIGTVLNMRDASLHVWVSDLTSDAFVSAKVCDEKYCSREAKMRVNGDNELPIKNVSDVSGFNPEKVVKVVLTASASATVTSIASSCPNAVGINSCSASYSGEKWSINASNLKNSNAAKKCRITSSLSSPDGDTGIVDCQSSIAIKDPDFYTRINTGDATVPQFTLYVYDDDEASLSSSPADSKECELSGSYSPVEISCGFENEQSGVKIYEGDLAPKLSYSITNCPSEMNCLVDVKLTNGTNTVSMDPAGKGLIDSWTPTTGANGIKFGSGYYYTVRAYKNDGTETTLGTLCRTSSTFDVQETIDADGFCEINQDDETVTIRVTGANYVDNVPVTLTYNDAFGISIGFEKINIGETQEATVSLKNKGLTGSTPLVLVLKVGGKNKTCSGTYTPEQPVKPNLSLTGCPKELYVNAPNANVALNGCDGETCNWSVDNGGSVSYSGGRITLGNVSAGQKYTVTVIRTSDNAFASCNDIEVKSNEVKPTVSGCPTSPIEVEPGAVATLTASVQDCGSSCSYEITKDNSHLADASFNVSQVTFTTESASGTVGYKFVASNSAGSDECSFSVNYKKPDFACPNPVPTATVGKDYVLKPQSIQYCDVNCSGVKNGVTVNKSAAGTYSVEVSLTNSAGTATKYCDVKFEEASACIAWVNGTGNYGGHCYNSGLSNMNGKCYKCNPDRGSDCNTQWMNDNASESYWWLETPCDGSGVVASSSSVAASSSSISSSSGGSGSGSKIALTETKTSFNAGTIYTLTTGSLGYGPHSLRCWVNQNASYSRTIGTFGGSSITIDSWQTQTNTFGSLSDNSEYTFIVSSDAPNDLTCALSN